MSIESTVVNTMRAMMNVLHPLTGDTRAELVLTITAEPGKELLLRPGAWVFPLIGGGAGSVQQMRPDLLFKTQTNPNREDGFWQVTDSGNQIPIISNIAGVRHNVGVGTPFSFDFVNPDIASIVVSGVTTPATDPGKDGFIQSMAIFEQAAPNFFMDLRRAEGANKFPAVVLAFSDLLPADGSTVDTMQRGAKVGTQTSLYRIDFQLSIFSSRDENDSRRRIEGLSILDSVMRYLTDRRQTDDNDCLSNPGGVQILQAFRDTQVQEEFQKYYVYTLLVAATVTLKMTDDRTFNPWLSTVLNVNQAQDPKVVNEGDLPLVANVEIEMPPATPITIMDQGAGVAGWWNIEDRADGLSPAIAGVTDQVATLDLLNATPAQQPTLTKLRSVEFGRMVFASTQHWHADGVALWPAASSDVTIWFTMRCTTFVGPEQTLFSSSDVTQITAAIALSVLTNEMTLAVEGIGSVTIDYQDPNEHLFRLHVGGGQIDLQIDGVEVASLVAAGTVGQAGEAINIGANLAQDAGLDGVFHEMVVVAGSPTEVENNRMSTYMMAGAGL